MVSFFSVEVHAFFKYHTVRQRALGLPIYGIHPSLLLNVGSTGFGYPDFWALRMTRSSVIMGIDPGTNVLGYGVIKVIDNTLTLLSAGSVHTSTKQGHYSKLKRIYLSMQELFDRFRPDVVSIEAPFFGKNVQSMLKLGRAQGMAMAVALSRELEVVEYAPKKVKQSVTGNGNASKEQVAAMLSQILKCPLDNRVLDATDGLAVAVCHFFQSSGSLPSQASNSTWKQFIEGHPERLAQS